MPRYAAFLRGINLGNRRVKNERLRECFESLGLEDVAVFRASGNVVFESRLRSRAKLTDLIEAGLGDALGYEVATFIRNGTEMRALAASKPFTKAQVTRSQGRLQVSLLRRRPSATAGKKVLALAGSDDRLALGERELFWLPRAGTQQSQLDLKAIDALLGTTTMRTMGTIEQIAAKHFDA